MFSNIIPIISSRINCIWQRILPILLTRRCTALSAMLLFVPSANISMGIFITEKVGCHLTQLFKKWKQGMNFQRPNVTYALTYLPFFWASSWVLKTIGMWVKKTSEYKKAKWMVTHVSKRKYLIMSRILFSFICTQMSKDKQLKSVCCVKNILRQFQTHSCLCWMVIPVCSMCAFG